jgi:NAD(P)-dependent dehydrogenase (short-subunit alcohol dehydrogenase family)
MHCDGRVVIVTGAAHGIGREHALELARQGARVLVNDLGGDVHGQGADLRPVDDVVDEIKQLGGEAVANFEDVSDFDGAQRMVRAAIEAFGELHVLVNNAGILRDRMHVNMSPDEWDAVIRVHLRGTFAPTRHATAYWRDLHKQGYSVAARVINTSSASGLYGNIGQSHYGAAKAGIAAFTIITAEELARYGITVNAIAPAARTRMTEDLPHWAVSDEVKRGEVFDENSPANISPLVAWLASEVSEGVTGQVFNIRGGTVDVALRWAHGPRADKGDRWEVAEFDEVIPRLIAELGEHRAPVTSARRPAGTGPDAQAR